MTGRTRPRLRQLVALVVDDEAPHRKLVSERIKDHCVVYEASSSEEALEITKRCKVDVLFTDSNLPVRERKVSDLPRVDGKEMVRQLRLKGYHGAIVFVSAGADQPSVYMEMVDAGADAILVKPYKGDELREIFRAVVGDRPPAKTSAFTRVMRGIQNRSQAAAKNPSDD